MKDRNTPGMGIKPASQNVAHHPAHALATSPRKSSCHCTRRSFVVAAACAAAFAVESTGRSQDGRKLGTDTHMKLLDAKSRLIAFERLAQTRLGPPAPGRKRAEDMASEILAICDVLASAYSISGPWRVDGFGSNASGPVGPPPRPITLSEQAVSDYLHDIEDRNRAGRFANPIFSSRVGGSTLMFLLAEDPLTSGGIASLSLHAPHDVEPTGGHAALVAALSAAFGAFNAHVRQEDLFHRYVARRVNERLRDIRASLSPEASGQLPGIPADFSDGVDLDLLHPIDFDRRLAPTGVWWINYWDAVQLRTLGERKVRAAGWANVTEAADGAVVLSATSQPIDLRDRAHLQQLERLLREIGLREAQERCRGR
jgi:hypothetical protein